MTTISTRQNEPEAIALIRAFRQAYTDAKSLGHVQLALGLLGPILGAATEWKWKAATPFVAIIVTVGVLVDILFLEPGIKEWQELGAKLQEEFDHRVLAFPWRSTRRPERGAAKALANKHAKAERSVSKLKDWYPVEAASLPLELGRIVCQRSNVMWDAGARKTVFQVHVACLLALIVVVLSVGCIRGHELGPTIVSTVVPAFGLGVRIARSASDHRLARERSERARNEIDRLWAELRSGQISIAQLEEKARENQSEIYENRLRAPQVPDLMYALGRNALEEKMREAAKEMAAEAQDVLAAKQGPG